MNGSEIEDGLDLEMPDLVGNLQQQKGMRDQLISSGAKQGDRVKVQIDSSGIAEHQAAISVLNACSEAGVNKVTFGFKKSQNLGLNMSPVVNDFFIPECGWTTWTAP